MAIVGWGWPPLGECVEGVACCASKFNRVSSIEIPAGRVPFGGDLCNSEGRLEEGLRKMMKMMYVVLEKSV